jgi:hypothetical protein
MDEIAKAARVLWRYKTIKTWYRRKVGSHLQGLLIDQLAYLMCHRKLLFDDGAIEVDPKKSPPITRDSNDPDFFQAIIMEAGDLPDIMSPGRLAECREYVLREGDTPLYQPEDPAPGVDFRGAAGRGEKLPPQIG